MTRPPPPTEGLPLRIASRLRALRRLGRRAVPQAPTWGLATVWFRSSFLPSQNYLILLSVLVGLLTGLGSVGFIRLLGVLTSFARVQMAGALEIGRAHV